MKKIIALAVVAVLMYASKATAMNVPIITIKSVQNTYTVADIEKNGSLTFFAGKTVKEQKDNAEIVLCWFNAKKTLGKLLKLPQQKNAKGINDLFSGGLTRAQHTITRYILVRGRRKKSFSITMDGTCSSVNALKFTEKYFPRQLGDMLEH